MTVTMRQLGTPIMGRFGNQVLQYIFLRTYCDRWGQELQLPEWAGRKLFGLKEPSVSVILPEWYSQLYGPPIQDELCGKDFVGFAHEHTGHYRESRERIRELLTPVNAPPPMDVGTTRIGLHIRRGDYGYKMFHLTPTDWYLSWLQEHWSRFTDPVLFVATDDPRELEAFTKYRPLRADPIEGAPDFFSDWWMLAQCEVLVTANSTFSFSAAMANRKLLEFWRSKLPVLGFVKEDLWWTGMLNHDCVEDYPNIPGIRREECRV